MIHELREFSLVNRYFDRVSVASRRDVETGIGDDCALLNVPEKQTLAISTDTLVCGRHFLHNINPADLAYKALAINISDLAAMGASPAWLTLALTIPEIDESWLAIFSNALFEQLNYYDMQLIGGDTTAGPLSITLAIYGFVPIGNAIKRSGAKPGDWVCVTGTLGDSAVGLAILQNRLIVENTGDMTYFIKRHLHPIPRVLHGQKLREYATSAIDISDGLISDLGHILKASVVGAHINLDVFPFSNAMLRNVELEKALHWALAGGEDYELLFTVPAELYHDTLHAILHHLGIPITYIGRILPESYGLQFIRNGVPIELDSMRFDHFYNGL